MATTRFKDIRIDPEKNNHQYHKEFRLKNKAERGRLRGKGSKRYTTQQTIETDYETARGLTKKQMKDFTLRTKPNYRKEDASNLSELRRRGTTGEYGPEDMEYPAHDRSKTLMRALFKNLHNDREPKEGEKVNLTTNKRALLMYDQQDNDNKDKTCKYGTIEDNGKKRCIKFPDHDSQRTLYNDLHRTGDGGGRGDPPEDWTPEAGRKMKASDYYDWAARNFTPNGSRINSPSQSSDGDNSAYGTPPGSEKSKSSSSGKSKASRSSSGSENSFMRDYGDAKKSKSGPKNSPDKTPERRNFMSVDSMNLPSSGKSSSPSSLESFNMDYLDDFYDGSPTPKKSMIMTSAQAWKEVAKEQAAAQKTPKSSATIQKRVSERTTKGQPYKKNYSPTIKKTKKTKRK